MQLRIPSNKLLRAWSFDVAGGCQVTLGEPVSHCVAALEGARSVTRVDSDFESTDFYLD